MLVAKQAYLRELQQQLATATKAGKFDDATAVNELKKTLEAEIKVLQDSLTESRSRDLSLPPTPAEQAFLEALKVPVQDAGRVEPKAKVHAPSTHLRRFTIAAAEPWQKVVAVKKGDKLKIAAAGTWCLRTSTRAELTCGPDGIADTPYIGILRARPIGALLGRTGSSIFVIGKGTELIVEQDGDLEMQANDTKITDNDGELTATIRVLAD